MIPEPNLWADLRERERSLDEISAGPDFGGSTQIHLRDHHSDSCRTLTLPRSHREHFKEELQIESGPSAANPVNQAESENARQQRQKWTRRWYLLVIVLLYVGLLASFSLNVSLLLRKPTTPRKSDPSAATPTSSSVVTADELGAPAREIPDSADLDAGQPTIGAGGYAYTTSCLVKVPCESGNYWKCDINECTPCPQGFYQPQWGQTSCWPCPYNTTTDGIGSIAPTDCKRHKCPFYIKDGLGVVESPNFPGEYPAGAECHWRVRPGRNKRVLVIISNIQLGEECGDVLTIRRTDKPKSGIIYETCNSHDEPVIFTGHSRNLWVDFMADHNSSGQGFQISFLTIEDELGYLVDAIVNDDKIGSFDKRPGEMTLEDKHLLSRLLLLLNPTYPGQANRSRRPSRKKKPIINVIEGDEGKDDDDE